MVSLGKSERFSISRRSTGHREVRPGFVRSLLLLLASDLNCLHYRNIRWKVVAARRKTILPHEECQNGRGRFIAEAARTIERHVGRYLMEEVTHRAAIPMGKKRITAQRRSSACPTPENVSAFQSPAVTRPAWSCVPVHTQLSLCHAVNTVPHRSSSLLSPRDAVKPCCRCSDDDQRGHCESAVH